MNISDVSIFLVIASSGSLSRAARQLGISNVMVSRRLSALEKKLAARLFHRTTRSLSLTAEGEAFLPYARSLLEITEAAEAALTPAAGATGTLRVTAPVVFGQSHINPFIPELLKQNPAMRVDLVFTDSIVDLVSQGMDLAIRVAPMKSSGLVARKLADNPRLLCAAPQYLERHGIPRSLEELKSHECLILHGMEFWPFKKGVNLHPLRMSGRLYTSSLDTILTATLNGLGIALMTYWDVRQQLVEGSLVEIQLEDASLEELAIWAVFPTRLFMPARVSVFLKQLEITLNTRNS